MTKSKGTKMDSEKTNNWYYVAKGERVGPISLQELRDLVTKEKINEETKVWNGEGDWKSAKETELADMFKRPAGVPPPLSGTDVDNKFVWFVVAVPIIGLIIEYMIGRDLAWIYWIINIVLCVLDERKLKSAGHKAPTTWWAIIIPVYLWKRAGLLKQTKNYFWGWIASFIIAILISITKLYL